MAKYQVIGNITASIIVGEYEADSPEEAIEKAEEDKNAFWMPTLCHQCSNEVSLGDVFETEAEEI